MTSTSLDQLPAFLPGPGAMLFCSFEYLLLFLPVTILGWFALNQLRHPVAARAWLALASLFFYGWWSLSYLWLLGSSILVNYVIGYLLSRQLKGAKWLLVAGIICNLSLLAYYKYADFFLANLNQLKDMPVVVQQALPLGISFFTFTQIAFLVDVYRGQAREYRLLHYVLFISFFPHLIAGPILHHKEMMPQFASRIVGHLTWHHLFSGIGLIGIGVFKKVVLADSLAGIANVAFVHDAVVPFHQAWLSSLAYTLQLYFDFSGYTDMAIGSALLFNIRLPDNFRSPYRACDIQDFWRRWHMTLSRWLRDYLYIPLGGNRHGALRSCLALLVTFILGGLWHGANWTFLVWGLLHGAAAIVHKTWRSNGWALPAWAGWILTFLFVNAAWVAFRADTVTSAIQVWRSMIGMNGVGGADELSLMLANLTEADTWNPLLPASPGRNLLLLATGLMLALLGPDSNRLAVHGGTHPPGPWHALAIFSITGISIFYLLYLSTGTASFIYFYF